MSNHTYVIRCECNGPLGIVCKTLGDDCVWYLATNRAISFGSVREARAWFFSPGADAVAPVGSCIWVEGPRGGTYAMCRNSFNHC